MIIQIKKFGDILISRDAGKEALAAFRPTLRSLAPDEKIQIDFSGVSTIGPSWMSEFVTVLQNEYEDRVVILPTDNPAVNVTLEFLKSIRK